MHTIIQLCLFCKQVIDIIDGKGESGNSHGCCKECVPHARKRLGLKSHSTEQQVAEESNSLVHC